jgi:hypothetical protein
MRDHAFLDVSTALAKAAGNVLNAMLSLRIVKYLSEELSRLLVVVIGVRVFIPTDSSTVMGSVPCGGLVFNGSVK